MNTLTTSVIKADRKEAVQLANSLKQHKAFKVSIEKDLITIKAPLKDDAGEWVRNENNKIKRFLVFQWSNKDGMQQIKYNPKVITV